MNAVTFDTLKFAQNLRDKANFSPAQAEGISEAFSEAISGQLVTRADLVALATKDDISALRNELSSVKDDISTLKVEVSGVKDDVAALKDNISGLRNEFSSVKNEMSSIKN